MGVSGAETGAVSFPQRFGGSLNLHIHFHTLAVDGVLERQGESIRLHEAPAPTKSDVADVVRRVHDRTRRSPTPPTIEFFVREPTWVTWGTMDSGDASNPYFFHLALGTLKETDIAKNQMAHDQVAAGGKAPSIGAGNVAHIVFLGLADKRRFVGVDIWSKADNIQAFYTKPMFVAAFAPLFESVTQPVYHSTDWHQW